MSEVDEALKRLTRFLDKHGLKSTSQRRLITRIFFDERFRQDHPSVEDLYVRVHAEDGRVGYATIYRTLKLLVDAGLASPSRLTDNQTRYEPDIPGEHHDHLVCTACGAILEFEEDGIEVLQEAVAQRLGFRLADHRMVLYGAPDDPCRAPACPREAVVR